MQAGAITAAGPLRKALLVFILVYSILYVTNGSGLHLIPSAASKEQCNWKSSS